IAAPIRSARASGFSLTAPASTIAALVARSPCAGSRGGSIAMRPKSIPRGSAPASTISSSAARTSRRKSPKILLIVCSSYRRVGIEQPAMLVECESVGHAGEVIGDDPGGLGLFAAGQRAPLARQTFGFAKEQLKQLAHDPPRF